MLQKTCSKAIKQVELLHSKLLQTYKQREKRKYTLFSSLNIPSHTNWARFLNGNSCCVMKLFSSAFRMVRMFAVASETRTHCC